MKYLVSFNGREKGSTCNFRDITDSYYTHENLFDSDADNQEKAELNLINWIHNNYSGVKNFSFNLAPDDQFTSKIVFNGKVKDFTEYRLGKNFAQRQSESFFNNLRNAHFDPNFIFDGCGGKQTSYEYLEYHRKEWNEPSLIGEYNLVFGDKIVDTFVVV